MIKKLFILIPALILGLFVSKNPVFAAACSAVGECVNGRICVQQYEGGEIRPVGATCGDNIGQSVIGGVTPPKSISTLNRLAGQKESATIGIGLILFLSRVLRLFTIVTGMFVIANVILAAYAYIIESGSDVKEKVKERFTMTAIGLAIIVGAYTLAAIIGLIFFGDATFILSPELYSALDMQ